MAVVVLAAEVVDVSGGDQRPAELARDLDDALVRLLLLGDAVALHLEVDLLGPEGVDEVVHVGTGVLGAVLDQPAAEARLQASGERDHALRMGGEQLQVDVRLAAREALEEAGGAQLHQVAETRLVGGEEGEMVALVPRGLWSGDAVIDEIGLEADDRLDPRALARLVVLDRPVHHAVVGEPERRHLQLGRPRRELVDLAGPVEQRVLAVDVQMDGSGAHRSILTSVPDVTGGSQKPNAQFRRPHRADSFRGSDLDPQAWRRGGR